MEPSIFFHRSSVRWAVFELWRSNDAGATFSAPSLVTTEGHFHYDQRMAVDAKGTIYISYMDNETARPRSVTRLRLARSRDEGRTFSVETVTTQRVSDKPELAVSADGMHIAIVFESSPGPTLVSSDDGGAMWNEPRVVVQGEGRHFWPEVMPKALGRSKKSNDTTFKHCND